MMRSKRNKAKNKNGSFVFLLFTFIVLLLELLLLFIYDLPTNSWLLFMGTVLLFVLLAIKRVRLHVAGWWLYIYLICAFLVVSAFKYVTPMSLSYTNIQERGFVAMASTTISIVFILLLSFLLIYRNPNYLKDKLTDKRLLIRIPYSTLFVIACVSSVISHILGIGKMGTETYSLPFHLSGALQFYRAELFPLLALIEYNNMKQLKDNNRMKKFILLYALWALYECILRLSKSAFITSFLPIIIYEMFSINKIGLSTIKKATPILLISLSLFLVMPLLRDSEGGISSEDVAESSKKEVVGGKSRTSFFVFPYTRMFYSGYLYLVDVEYLNEDGLFDFSKAPLILISGGSAVYQTRIIDGYPEENIHSSGSSPFIDSLLLGGYGLLYLTIIIFVLFAHYIDNKIWKGGDKISIAILCAFFYRVFDMLSFSFIVDINMIKWIIIYGVALIYIRIQASKFEKSRFVQLNS